MIGTKMYQKKSKVIFFLVMYGILACIGLGLIVFSVSRSTNPSGAEGFMLIFGAGMAILTWIKSRKPRIVIREEHLELLQQNRPRNVPYKSISNVTKKGGQLVLGVRDGHRINNVVVWLNDLEPADAGRLTEFCEKKGWKKR